MKTKLTILAIGGLMLICPIYAKSQVVEKENKSYYSYPETRTRQYYQSDKDIDKAGWRTEKDTVYIYREKNNNERSGKKEGRNK